MTSHELRRFTEIGRKIVGIGFNYVGLMKELKVPQAKEPRLYLKATSAYITQGQKIKIPDWSKEGIWYEVELGIIMGERLSNATEDQAVEAIGGFCTALDLTDKERLLTARKTGQAWGIAKSFNTACPVGNLIPKDRIKNLDDVNLYLKINGELRQHGNTSDMSWPVPNLLSIISKFMVLEPGDMVLTGTPGGIGTCKHGDVIEAGIRGVDDIQFEVE